jgi:hypothetical protein
MFCSFHQKIRLIFMTLPPLEEQGFSGLTCILVQVAIFRPSPSAHYLNVTINNVVKVRTPQSQSATTHCIRQACWHCIASFWGWLLELTSLIQFFMKVLGVEMSLPTQQRVSDTNRFNMWSMSVSHFYFAPVLIKRIQTIWKPVVKFFSRYWV